MASNILIFLFSCAMLVNTFEMDDVSCPEGCICNMVESLRGAFCVGEKLTTIEAHIPELVQYLDFSDNMISKLEDFAFKDQNMIKLVVLNMSTNSLSQISLRAFEGLNQLQIVDLSDNVLHSLPEDLFENNLHLLKLYLAGNKFGFLEAQPLLNSHSLQVLDLSRCVIAHLHPTTFSKLPNLTTININHNFIIQLTIPTFESLLQLKSLTFVDNKLHCNDEMSKLVSYLTKRQIEFVNICHKEEKFQKLIIQAVTTEKSSILNWDFDICSNIETIEQLSNHTNNNCEVMNQSSNFSRLVVGVGFVFGVIVGISATYSCLHCVSVLKRRNKMNRRLRLRQTFHQPRDELLLSDTSFNLGLSTPVLSRSGSRHSTIIR